MMGWDHSMCARTLIGGLAALAVPWGQAVSATRSYTFNAADQLVEVTEGSTVVASHGYDGDGERVTRSVGGVETIYVRDPEGRVLAEYHAATGDLVAEYVYVNGRKAARIAGDGTETFYHDDHLGTPVAITDRAGRVVWRGETLPFGAEVDATGDRDDRYTFTGHEHDAELGLHWMHARSYSAEIGRFIGPDPAPGDPAAPQSWNRYAYVGNNPLRYTDPDGRYKEDVHYYLTRYLALAAGHPVDTADTLALHNRRVDDWAPAAAMVTFDVHFMTTDQAVTLFSVLPESIQGTALHSVQDSYAHEGYGRPLGHLIDTLQGNDPDDTSRDVQKALQMALHTFALLGGAAEDLDREFLAGVFAIPDHETRANSFQREGDLIERRTNDAVDLRAGNR
jgi:RHS repeat-associated protein